MKEWELMGNILKFLIGEIIEVFRLYVLELMYSYFV